MILNTRGRPRKYPELKGPFNELITKRMQELDFDSLDQFAEYADINRTSIYQLVRGRLTPNGNWVKPSIEMLMKLAVAFNVPTHQLVYLLEPDAPGADQIQNTSSELSCFHVPVLGMVGAGPGQATEITETIVPVSADFAAGKHLVGYQVSGDSMAGGKHPIYTGDYVLVNAHDKGVSGQVVVARLRDGSMVCKAFKSDKFGTRLISTNPMYTNSAPPIITALDVDEIIGRVVRVVQDLESLEA
jgi:repressor LexA